jgi:hypothetical protein
MEVMKVKEVKEVMEVMEEERHHALERTEYSRSDALAQRRTRLITSPNLER